MFVRLIGPADSNRYLAWVTPSILSQHEPSLRTLPPMRLSSNSQVLDDPRQHFEILDGDIMARVEAYLARLAQKWAPLKQGINHLISPITRLPPDIKFEYLELNNYICDI
jgi:hypothetical protein